MGGIEGTVDKLGLSAYHRVFKISNTIADLEDCRDLQSSHVGEAIQCGMLERRIDW